MSLINRCIARLLQKPPGLFEGTQATFSFRNLRKNRSENPIQHPRYFRQLRNSPIRHARRSFQDRTRELASMAWPNGQWRCAAGHPAEHLERDQPCEMEEQTAR